MISKLLLVFCFLFTVASCDQFKGNDESEDSDSSETDGSEPGTDGDDPDLDPDKPSGPGCADIDASLVEGYRASDDEIPVRLDTYKDTGYAELALSFPTSSWASSAAALNKIKRSWTRILAIADYALANSNDSDSCSELFAKALEIAKGKSDSEDAADTVIFMAERQAVAGDATGVVASVEFFFEFDRRKDDTPNEARQIALDLYARFKSPEDGLTKLEESLASCDQFSDGPAGGCRNTILKVAGHLLNNSDMSSIHAKLQSHIDTAQAALADDKQEQMLFWGALISGDAHGVGIRSVAEFYKAGTPVAGLAKLQKANAAGHFVTNNTMYQLTASLASHGHIEEAKEVVESLDQSNCNDTVDCSGGDTARAVAAVVEAIAKSGKPDDAIAWGDAKHEEWKKLVEDAGGIYDIESSRQQIEPAIVALYAVVKEGKIDDVEARLESLYTDVLNDKTIFPTVVANVLYNLEAKDMDMSARIAEKYSEQDTGSFYQNLLIGCAKADAVDCIDKFQEKVPGYAATVIGEAYANADRLADAESTLANKTRNYRIHIAIGNLHARASKQDEAFGAIEKLTEDNIPEEEDWDEIDG